MDTFVALPYDRVMTKNTTKPKALTRGSVLRIRQEHHEALSQLAGRWNWGYADILERLLDVATALDAEAQQLLLGLPLDERRAQAAVQRIAAVILSMSKKT